PAPVFILPPPLLCEPRKFRFPIFYLSSLCYELVVQQALSPPLSGMWKDKDSKDVKKWPFFEHWSLFEFLSHSYLKATAVAQFGNMSGTSPRPDIPVYY